MYKTLVYILVNGNI